MLKRLFVGLVIGAIVGGLVAAGVIAGLGWVTLAGLPAFLGYALAAATGALTGLVAGKPIWASGGQIEAGLKAFFGALLAAGGLYAIRTWLHFDVDLAVAHAGSGLVGELPGARRGARRRASPRTFAWQRTPRPSAKRSLPPRSPRRSALAERCLRLACSSSGRLAWCSSWRGRR
jgi:hypothetical protein